MLHSIEKCKPDRIPQFIHLVHGDSLRCFLFECRVLRESPMPHDEAIGYCMDMPDACGLRGTGTVAIRYGKSTPDKQRQCGTRRAIRRRSDLAVNPTMACRPLARA